MPRSCREKRDVFGTSASPWSSFGLRDIFSLFSTASLPAFHLSTKKPPKMHYLDPQNAAFAAAIANDPAPHQLGYVKGREALEVLQKHEAAPDISTETLEVPGKCGPTSVTIVRAKSLATKQLPMVFYMHGGGWILGR